MDRVAIFIDGGYLNKVLEADFSRRSIYYDKLSKELAGNLEILRTYYYNCPPYQGKNPNAKEKARRDSAQRFYHSLSQLPRFQVRLGKLAFRGYNDMGKPIYVQKRVDIMFGVDLVSIAATKQISHAMLISGDSDFVPAVIEAKRYGVIVTLWHGSAKTFHQELWDECDDRCQISEELIHKISM